MRSRRSGSGRPLGDTRVSGRRVTPKAPSAHVERGSGQSEAPPTAILQDTHSVEGEFSEVVMQNRAWGPGIPTIPAAANTHDREGRPLHIARRYKDALGWMRGAPSGCR